MKPYFILLAFALLFISCEKEEIEEETVVNIFTYSTTINYQVYYDLDYYSQTWTLDSSGGACSYNASFDLENGIMKLRHDTNVYPERKIYSYYYDNDIIYLDIETKLNNTYIDRIVLYDGYWHEEIVSKDSTHYTTYKYYN